jgi:hypothetical protein
LLDSSSAFQGRGPSTVLTVDVLAHREAAQAVRIDSRTHIPLFIAKPISVNKKQPLSDKFIEKIFVRSVSEPNEKETAATSLPRRFPKARKPRVQPR